SDPTTELMTFDLDLVGWLMGRPRSVAAIATDFQGAPGEVSALLSFADGRSATILASGAMPAAFPFTTGFRANFQRAAIVSETVLAGADFSSRTQIFGPGGVTAAELAASNPYQVELEHFCAAIRGEADAARLDVERALEALR